MSQGQRAFLHEEGPPIPAAPNTLQFVCARLQGLTNVTYFELINSNKIDRAQRCPPAEKQREGKASTGEPDLLEKGRANNMDT